MSVATTSKEAFKAVQYELVGRRLEVYDAICELGVASNDVIAARLGWEINRITPRVNELVKMKKVELHEIRPGRYGHRVKVWRPTAMEQLSLIEQDCND